jgi:hypothetical protein
MQNIKIRSWLLLIGYYMSVIRKFNSLQNSLKENVTSLDRPTNELVI